jgi:hypothetical protein
MSDIAVHIIAEHENETLEVEAHFMVELLDFVEASRYRRVVICSGVLFYLTWEREGDILNFGVFHFGLKNETNFKCGIKFGNSGQCVSVTGNCHSYLDGDLTELQHSYCVTLPYSTLLDCLNASGHLSCEIEIGTEKLDGFVSGELQEFLQVAVAFGSEGRIGTEMLGIPSTSGRSSSPSPSPKLLTTPQAKPQSLPVPKYAPPPRRVSFAIVEEPLPTRSCFRRICCWCFST